MKKFILIFSAVALSAVFATACGREKALVEHNDDAFHIVETEVPTTVQKIKSAKTDANIDTSAETDTISAENEDKSENTTTESNVTPVKANNPDSSEIPDNTAKNTDNSDNNADIPKEYYILEGIVYKVKNGSIMLNEVDMKLMNIGFEDKTAVNLLKTGDKVKVKYDGNVAESYPLQVINAYSVEVTEKAEQTYKMEHFICNNKTVNLNFSLLLPEGWTTKEIDYPTEGDFTDWGFRIIPKGENTGLDISWHSAFSVREPFDIFPITVNNNNAKKYSSEGDWRFYAYDNGFIASNKFYDTNSYDKYAKEFEFILDTLSFGQAEFIG